MGLISCMYLLTLSKLRFSEEGFPTFTTFVRFLLFVNALMFSEVEALVEGFPTDSTLMEFLS